MEKQMVITVSDLDKHSVNMYNNKLSVIDTNSIYFTEEEQVVDLLINGLQLVFRKIDQTKNPSNCNWLCTNVRQYGQSLDSAPVEHDHTHSIDDDGEGADASTRIIITPSSDYFVPELTVGETVTKTYTFTIQGSNGVANHSFTLYHQFDESLFDLEVSTDSVNITGLTVSNGEITGNVTGNPSSTITANINLNITPKTTATDVTLNGFGSSMPSGKYVEDTMTNQEAYFEAYDDYREITIRPN